MTSAATEPTTALPPKRAAFAREYLRDLNGARAARDVGYAPKSASVEASRLLDNVDVQAEITRLRAVLAEQTDVTPEKIVAELAAIAFADLGDYIHIHTDGTASVDLSTMSPGASRAIASVDVVESRSGGNRTRIKLHDKHAALVTLARTLGMVQDGSVNVLVQTHDTEKMKALTLDDLRKSLDSGVFDKGEAVEITEESDA